MSKLKQLGRYRYKKDWKYRSVSRKMYCPDHPNIIQYSWAYNKSPCVCCGKALQIKV